MGGVCPLPVPRPPTRSPQVSVEMKSRTESNQVECIRPDEPGESLKQH